MFDYLLLNLTNKPHDFFSPLSPSCNFFTPLCLRAPSDALTGVPAPLEKRWLKRHRTVKGRWCYGS